MHGKGILYENNGNIKYDGDYSYGKMNGTGKFKIGDNLYYIGEFSNNFFHGNGMLIDNDGEILYEGKYNYGIQEEIELPNKEN